MANKNYIMVEVAAAPADTVVGTAITLRYAGTSTDVSGTIVGKNVTIDLGGGAKTLTGTEQADGSIILKVT